MVKRFGLVTLVLVLSVTCLGCGNKTPTVAAAAPIASPAIRPLDVVTSSVSRGLASLRSQRIGFNADKERRAGPSGNTGRASCRESTRSSFDCSGTCSRSPS